MIRLLLLAIFGSLLLWGCAEPERKFQIAAHPDRWDGDWPVWPKGVEVPRFVYVGDVTGEENFAIDGNRGDPGRLIAWLVGLGQERTTPQVLQRPQGVVEGSEGRIWVTDVSRRSVLLFDSEAGRLHEFDRVSGNRRFIAPIGLAALPDGSVWVSDAELGLLARLTPEGSTNEVIEAGWLIRPTGLAYHAASGRLFVADTRANAIRVIGPDGTLQYSIGREGTGDGQLNAPTYLALAGDRLYVTDTLNARIQVFDLSGDFLRSFGERGLYVGNLARPKGLAVSEDGLVYVVESYYDHLLVFDLEGRLLLAIGGTGQRPGQFYLPAGVWAGHGGRVYVADMFNGRISVLQYMGDGS